MSTEQIDSTLKRLTSAQHIAVLTGAGLSADSGLPTYRSGPDALWSLEVAQDIASAKAWRQQPLKVWEWHLRMREKILASQPNAGHLALAQLAQSARVSILTQNIDDLHERAGSTDVCHLHGQVRTVVCVKCRSHAEPDLSPAQLMACPRCGGRMRPDVVLFNESLNPASWQHARSTVRKCDVLLVVGTSCEVFPVADLPRYALKRRRHVVEINPRETPASTLAHASLRLTAAQGLPWLVKALQSTLAAAIAHEPHPNDTNCRPEPDDDKQA